MADQPIDVVNTLPDSKIDHDHCYSVNAKRVRCTRELRRVQNRKYYLTRKLKLVNSLSKIESLESNIVEKNEIIDKIKTELIFLAKCVCRMRSQLLKQDQKYKDLLSEKDVVETENATVKAEQLNLTENYKQIYDTAVALERKTVALEREHALLKYQQSYWETQYQGRSSYSGAPLRLIIAIKGSSQN